jgi:hypothetical protein
MSLVDRMQHTECLWCNFDAGILKFPAAYVGTRMSSMQML